MPDAYPETGSGSTYTSAGAKTSTYGNVTDRRRYSPYENRPAAVGVATQPTTISPIFRIRTVRTP